MTMSLVRRYQTALAEQMPRPTGRQRRAVGDAAVEGLEAAARIRSAAHAAHVGVVAVGMLSREEDRLVRSFAYDDVGAAIKVEARVRVLIDTFVGVASAELADLGT